MYKDNTIKKDMRSARMSKEKKVRKHKVLSHPIVALFLLMLWGMSVYQIFGVIIQGVLGEDFTGFGAAIGAVVALLIHKVWFAPEFKGSVGKPAFRSKDVMFAVIAFAVMLIGMDIFNLVTHDVALVLAALGTAVMAGVGEEMSLRVLPMSVMMRDWMDEKHIPFVAYSTSVFFGLVHFLNLFKGAALSDTIFQCISAVGIGVMFGAIYLRTGNILLCMILHALHDLLALMVVGATDSNGVILEMSTFDAITSVIVGVVGLALGTYLIRKSVRADIVAVWKERWNQK